jgi:hypothetical protein
MMKALMTVLLCVGISSVAFGQADLTWTIDNVPVDHFGNDVTNNSTSVSLGALVQLVVCHNAVISPTITGDGTSGDNVVIDYTGCGFDTFNGAFWATDTLANYGLANTNFVFIRVWDQKTSGSGNIPDSTDYGSGNIGWYYVDSAAVLISSLPDGGAGHYEFKIADISQESSWTFLPIPEPASMSLGLVGLGIILIRRKLMRK